MTRWLLLAGLLAGALVGMIVLPAAGGGGCRTAAPPYGRSHHRTAIEELVVLFQHVPTVTVPAPVAAASPAAGAGATTPAPPPAEAPSPTPSGPPLVRRAGPPIARFAAQTPGLDHVRVFAQHCASCHQAGKKTAGRVAIFDAAGRFAPNRPLAELVAAVESGAMPPPGKGRLSAAEKGAVRAAR